MARKKKLRVALIFGGTSEERGVSLTSGRTVAQNLDPKKYEVIPIEISQTGQWLTSSETIRQIGKEIRTKKIFTSLEVVPITAGHASKIDMAFLALHGPGGEDGTIQGMLELFKIPYTFSGVLASAVAMDKAKTKRLLAGFGLSVLPHLLIEKEDYKLNRNKILKTIHGKVVIKPNQMGSSLGVTITSEKKEIKQGLDMAFKHDHEVMVESFISGRELTVPVLGNKNPRTLPVIEIVPKRGSQFFDFRAKYDPNFSDEIVPAPITSRQAKEIERLAIIAHKALACRGVTRSDFIMDKQGKMTFLEINTIPGMTPNSLVPKSAAAAGIPFPKLLDKLIDLALDKE
jgi:D-alanine-D-alanine ligase